MIGLGRRKRGVVGQLAVAIQAESCRKGLDHSAEAGSWMFELHREKRMGRECSSVEALVEVEVLAGVGNHKTLEVDGQKSSGQLETLRPPVNTRNPSVL